MAFTLNTTKTVFGNLRVHVIDVTADAATQTIDTGMKVIIGHALGVQSCATMGFKVYANSNASGVQSFGVLGVSGLVSGDEFYVTVFGR